MIALIVKGTGIPTCELLTAIVPVYWPSVKVAAGVSSTVTVEDCPGASEGIVAGVASDM